MSHVRKKFEVPRVTHKMETLEVELLQIAARCDDRDTEAPPDDEAPPTRRLGPRISLCPREPDPFTIRPPSFSLPPRRRPE